MVPTPVTCVGIITIGGLMIKHRIKKHNQPRNEAIYHYLLIKNFTYRDEQNAPANCYRRVEIFGTNGDLGEST